MPGLRSSWAGVAAAVLVVLVGLGIGAAVYGARTTPARAPAGGRAEPRVARQAALLAEPRAGANELATLREGTRLQLIGRSGDSAWLYATPADRPELSGWLPADAVADAGDLGALARVDSATGGLAGTQAGGGAPRPGPRPDLALHAVTSRQNRLAVLVANTGGADFAGAILVAVDGGTPVRVDVGKPLRPGEALDAVLNTEYVQRRARVAVTVISPDVPEETTENNRLEVVVGPDQPINLSLEAAAVDPADGRLAVDIRNRGPIPLVGTLTIGVRERPPSNRLVVVSDGALNVGAGGIQRFHVATPARIDLSKMTVSISTDAVADSDPSDDMFPR